MNKKNLESRLLNNDISDYIYPTNKIIKFIKNVIKITFPTIIIFMTALLMLVVISFCPKFKYSEFIYSICMGIGIIKILYKYGKYEFPHFRSELYLSYHNIECSYKIIIMYIFIAILLALASNSFTYLMKGITYRKISIIELVLEILVSVLLVPIYEELCRFINIKSIERVTSNQIVIILVQAILFAIMHINIISIIYAFVCGIIFGYIYYKHQSILLCYIMHAVFNIIGYIPTFTIFSNRISNISVLIICLITIISLLVGNKKTPQKG